MAVVNGGRSEKEASRPDHEVFHLIKDLNGKVFDEETKCELRRIVDDEQGLQLHTRVLAAEVLLRHCGWNAAAKDKICLLIAKLRRTPSHNLQSFLLTWQHVMNKHGYFTRAGGFEFFSSLLRTALKNLEHIKWTEDLKLSFFYGVALFHAIKREKESEKNIKLFIGSCIRTEEDALKMMSLCMKELPVGLETKYLLIQSIILRDKWKAMESFKEDLLSELAESVEDQHKSSGCAPALFAVIECAWNERLREWLLALACSPRHGIRLNAFRSWLSRLAGEGKNAPLLLELLRQSAAAALAPSFPTAKFPPSEENVHHLTAIDPYFGWEETEEVSSEKEAALHCSLHLITLLSLRRCSQLRWHDWRALIIKGALAANTECSYLGLKLLIESGLQLEEEDLRGIFWNNFYSEENEKKVMVEKLMNKNGKELFKKFIEEEKELERLTEEEENGGRFTILVSPAVSHLDRTRQLEDEPGSMLDKVRMRESEYNEEWLAKTQQRLNKLLCLSGSSSLSSCPSFTDFHENLNAAGVYHKDFGKEVVSLLTNLKQMGCVREEFALPICNQIFDVMLRCRYKSVVDASSILIEEMFRSNTGVTTILFNRALSLVLSDESECRSSSLSRPLVSAITCRPELTAVAESALLPLLRSPASLTLTQVKTLKLLISSHSKSKISAEFVEESFFASLTIQEKTADFLVASAARCFFAFCVKDMCPLPGAPLFCLSAERPFFYRRLLSLLRSLHILPTIISIQVLSFLSRYQFIATAFYGENQLRELEEVRSAVATLLLLTSRKRERRFIVDGLLALCTVAEQRILKEYCRERSARAAVQEDAMKYLAELLLPKRPHDEEEVRKILRRSEYVRRVEDVLSAERRERGEGIERAGVYGILQLSSEDEQSALAATVALNDLLLPGKTSLDREEKECLVEVAARLLRHERSTVRTLTSNAIQPLLSECSIGYTHSYRKTMTRLKEWSEKKCGQPSS